VRIAKVGLTGIDKITMGNLNFFTFDRQVFAYKILDII
jgi:hypothetical protein